MDDGVLAHPEVRQVLQAHLLDHSAEVDGGHAGAVLLRDLNHSAGYRQAHGLLLAVGVRWCGPPPP
ncbi:hypothetical protein [Streptomyces sp. NPDC051577]|uniref:hypothetical protein n=1 Tax=Streptomyces sp. NPDC051577 TaxID=3155166 RepID=UPI0034382278